MKIINIQTKAVLKQTRIIWGEEEKTKQHTGEKQVNILRKIRKDIVSMKQEKKAQRSIQKTKKKKCFLEIKMTIAKIKVSITECDDKIK